MAGRESEFNLGKSGGEENATSPTRGTTQPAQSEQHEGEASLTARQRMEKFLGGARHGSIKAQTLYDIASSKYYAAEASEYASKGFTRESLVAEAMHEAFTERVRWRKDYARGATIYRQEYEKAEWIWYAYQEEAERDPYISAKYMGYAAGTMLANLKDILNPKSQLAGQETPVTSARRRATPRRNLPS